MTASPSKTVTHTLSVLVEDKPGVLARVAALDATVAAAVTALEGVAVNSLDVDFVTDVNTLCSKIAAHWTEYYNTSACHIFKSVISSALNHGRCTRVSNHEAFTYQSRKVETSGC